MEEKLFGLSLAQDYVEVIKCGDKYFVRYDAGAHQPIWRQDEINADEAAKIGAGRTSEYAVMLELQRRLGPAAYQSNWTPPERSN